MSVTNGSADFEDTVTAGGLIVENLTENVIPKPNGLQQLIDGSIRDQGDTVEIYSGTSRRIRLFSNGKIQVTDYNAPKLEIDANGSYGQEFHSKDSVAPYNGFSFWTLS